MATFREQPYSNFNFLVDLGPGESKNVQAGFAEVVLPEASLDIVEHRSGNEKEGGVRKMPGRERYTNLVLKRGLIGAMDLYQWWNDARNGGVNAYRTVTIQLLNEDRTEVVWTWKLLRAWPARYRFSPLNAQGKETLIEELELVFERLEIE